MPSPIAKYKNGNYYVRLFDDGTKERFTLEDEFIPSFPESIDLKITDYCDVSERNLQLRELYLAGALHACDPQDKLAITFLDRYKHGLHRLYAIYAEKWEKGIAKGE